MSESGRFGDQVARLLADAAAAAGGGNWVAARSLAQAALILDPSSRDARQLVLDSEAVSAPPGERRQLTVMFSDVVGSTQMSSSTDPEVVRDVLRNYQTVCSEAIERHGGYVAQFIGDGVVAYFGYPTPHEDSAVRAVRAGLELQSALVVLAAAIRQRHGIDLAARVAVHTGLVVRAEMGALDRPDRDAIVGEAPNVAARLQQEARPGTLVISGATRALLGRQFVTDALGAVDLRGVDRPIELFEVVRETSAASLAQPPSDLTPFVNRTDELRDLEHSWRRAVDGESVAALIKGDPGIGKSRLGVMIGELAGRSGGTVLRGACSSFHTTTYLYAARRVLDAVWHIDSREDGAASIDRVRAALRAIGREDLLGLLAGLLELPSDGSWTAPELDGPQLREATIAGLIDVLIDTSKRRPLLLILDDLQWADPSTLDLLGRVLARRVPGLMLLMTARPEFQPPWSSAVDTVVITGLAHEFLHQLATSLSEGSRLEPASLEELIGRSDGVPLFMEELVRSAGTPIDLPDIDEASPTSTVPAALRDPLLARLSTPGLDLTLAQTIATIGQEADHQLVKAVTGLTDRALRERVDELVAGHLIEVTGGDSPVYRFRHHLVGDLAYDTQLRAARRKRHGEVADALVMSDSLGQASDAGAIAYHLEYSGRISEAVEAYVRSARGDHRKGASAEAIAKLDRALGLLVQVNDDKTAAALELSARQARGLVGVLAWGYTSPDAAADFQRCLDLTEYLGLSPDHVPSLTAALIYFLMHGDLERADRILAVDLGRAGMAVEHGELSVGARASITLFEGRCQAAVAEFEACLQTPFIRDLEGVPEEWPFPDDPAVVVWAFLGLARWLAGRPAAAREAFARAEERARSLEFPNGAFGLAYTKVIEVVTGQLAGDLAVVDAAIPTIRELADRHGFLFFSVCATVHAALVDASRGGSLQSLDGALQLFRFAGLGVWDPWLYTAQANILLERGDAAGALDCCDRAAEAAAGSGVRLHESETLRIRGLARVLLGEPAGHDDLLAAAAVAADQGAVVFELRARLAVVRSGGSPGEVARLAELVDAMAPSGTDLVEHVAATALLLEVGEGAG